MEINNNIYTLKDFTKCLTNSYAAIFFSQTKILGIILLVLSFFNPVAGLYGLVGVILSNVLSISLNLNKFKIITGYYGFNAALTGVAIGSIFPITTFSIIMLLASSMLVVMLCVFIEGILNKYYLPYLSFPFLITLWCILLAAQCTDDFVAFGILPTEGSTELNNNEIIVAINTLLKDLPSTIKEFLLCISYVFFQSNILFGLIVTIGLLNYSRIAFIMAMINHLIAYSAYLYFDINLYNIPYHFIGFNFIFTAIAIGCCYVIPSKKALLFSILYIPVQYLFLLSSTRLLSYFYLPTYSFAFCSTTLLYLYFIKVSKSNCMATIATFIERTPEETLYNSTINEKRLKFLYTYPIGLPFIGTWKVSQGINGKYTHKDNWKHAWDFIIEDQNGKQYCDEGTQVSNYYCFGKPIVAPADATIIAIENQVADNAIGFDNKEQNWGNYVILKIAENVYVAICHLKQGSINVALNQQIAKGQKIGLCGNSGHSMYPHIHMQIQASPIIGSPTIEYPLTDLIQLETGTKKYIKSILPKEGESYFNAEQSKEVFKAFNLTAYKTLCVRSKDIIENWTLKIDDWGLNYIDDGNGNQAWFNSTKTSFYFYRYEGKKKGNLYSFYLSNYNMHLSTNYNWSLEDQISLSISKKNILFYLQDILAVFHIFVTHNYKCAYTNKMNENDKIDFESEVSTIIFGKQKNKYSYKTTILDKKLYSIEINTGETTKTIQIEGEYYE